MTNHRHLYGYAVLRFDIAKKQHMYCFHCFDFINVIIFTINPCGPYSRLVGEKSDVTVFFNHLDPYLLTSDQSLVILPKLLLLLLLFSCLLFFSCLRLTQKNL